MPEKQPERTDLCPHVRKEVDSALPGKNIRLLYDTLTRTEAQALAQLRTGNCKLRGFLQESEWRRLTNVNVAKERKTREIFSFIANATSISGAT